MPVYVIGGERIAACADADLDIETVATPWTEAVSRLAAGVVKVYDHIIQIVPDAAVKPYLGTQRDTFVQVLDIVERYTANPTSKEGNDQIEALISGDKFVQAQSAVSGWTYQNCS